MKLITFLVPCYNSEKEMSRCIDSLLVAGSVAEIMIIDDGSIDNTGKIADDYAERYPDIVRVIHQENGGHGEGINQGVRHARGKYFKIVDSDDWLNEKALKAVIKTLKNLDPEGGVDLMVCNYVYEHADENIHTRTIGYRNVFPTGRVVRWKDTRPFLFHQLLTLHSCIFRTKVCRKSGVVLPKHMSYEDNLFVYGQLPFCKRLYYLPVNLYRYFIGREGQSVSAEVMSRKYDQQLFISEEIFKLYDIDSIRRRNPRLGEYMRHEAMFMFVITSIYTRMNNTKEADKALRDMWSRVGQVNPGLTFRMRYLGPCLALNIPGEKGRKLAKWSYTGANKVVRFN